MFSKTIAIGICVLISAPAFAGGVPGGKSDAWTQTGTQHYTNANNPDLRFDLATGRKAVPGVAAAAQANNPTSNDSENSVVSRPGSTLVDPQRTLD